MHRGKAPSRRGRLQKLTRNSDIVQSTSLANSFLREERNLDKKLQNLDTEKRLSLAKMDSEIKLYRKMNKNKIEKWEDNCDISDVSEAGSDEDEDVHVGHIASYDSNFKSKTGQYPKGNNSTSDAINSSSKYSSSFSKFTRFDGDKKELLVDMSKQFHHPRLHETYSDPSRIEHFFSRRSRDIPHHFDTKNGTTRPRSASGTQTQKANEFEDFNPRNRSMSIRHADHTGVPHGESQISGPTNYTGGHQPTGLGGHQARRLSHQMGVHQTSGMSPHTGAHQTTGSVFNNMDGHQASGLAQMEGHHAYGQSHHVGGHLITGSFHQVTGMPQFNSPTSGLSHHVGSHHITGSFHQAPGMPQFNSPTSGLSHHMGSHHTTGSFHQVTGMPQFNSPTSGLSHHMGSHHTTGSFHQAPGMPQLNKSSGLSHLTNGIPTSTSGEHKSIVRIRNLVHAEHYSAEPGHHKEDGIYLGAEGCKTGPKGPRHRHDSVSAFVHGLPKQQSNATHSTYDRVFQNSPPKHLGISIHNPMLFHPRFHNNLGLVDVPEEHSESTDPNSFHVLRKCRYLRIPKPCHDSAADHAWCT